MKKQLFLLALVLLCVQLITAQTLAADNKVAESITFSEPLKGPGIYGVFEGRSPCAVSRQFDAGMPESCDHLKWQLVLFRDSVTMLPLSYQLTTEMFERRPLKGKWIINKALIKGSTVYVLDAVAPGKPLYLMKGDENVLFILDENLQFRTGDADFSYTLNRVKKVLRANPQH